MSATPHPTLTLSSLFGKPTDPLSNLLADRELTWLGLGRQAIFAALSALNVPKGSKVLTPAYQCSSSLEPLLKFGVVPIFYDVSPDLGVNLDRLEQLVVEHRPALIMLIHYYGFELRDASAIHRLCEKHGIHLLEDCAQSLLSQCGERPLGALGAASVFSFSKALPSPGGGGLLALRKGIGLEFRPSLAAPHSETLGLAKQVAYRIEQFLPFSLRTVLRSFSLADQTVRRKLEFPADSAESCLPREIGKLTSRLVARLDYNSIVSKRRENFFEILDTINSSKISGLHPIFSELPLGVCPLGFPVLIEHDRDQLQRRLWRKGIPVRAVWDRLPTQVSDHTYPGAAALRNQILLLPVHQSLRANQAGLIARQTLNETEIVRQVISPGTSSGRAA